MKTWLIRFTGRLSLSSLSCIDLWSGGYSHRIPGVVWTRKRSVANVTDLFLLYHYHRHLKILVVTTAAWGERAAVAEAAVGGRGASSWELRATLSETSRKLCTLRRRMPKTSSPFPWSPSSLPMPSLSLPMPSPLPHSSLPLPVLLKFHPRNRRDRSEDSAGLVTRSDMVLESSLWIANVVGKISEVDQCDPCPCL